jgi:DNA (cytosine-5)-methyltransferase 1
MKFKLGELFCGPGGLALGASKAKIKVGKDIIYSVEHIWASDYDEDTCDTYSENIFKGKKKAICKDVKELDIDSLEEIDCFMYGFPCNDFSIVGETKGFDGKFGPLYSYGIKVINKFKPKWFLAENVGGLSSANEGRAFKNIIKDLSACGYNLTIHKYKFEDYGVP